MKTVHVVCKQCGHEERISILTGEEIERDPRRPRSRVICQKCGSPNVTIHG